MGKSSNIFIRVEMECKRMIQDNIIKLFLRLSFSTQSSLLSIIFLPSFAYLLDFSFGL